MQDTPSLFVQGIGTAVPDRSLNPQGSIELFRPACRSARTAKLLRRIVRLTGIEKRHLAVLDYQFGEGEPLYLPAEEQPCGPGMGARMALFDKESAKLVRRALDVFSDASLGAIDALVTCSCTHASSPGLELPILRHTPVPTAAQRWNLGFMGCSAALAAMRLVHQTAAKRQSALMVACELSSLHFQYTDNLDQMTANLLFADGAGAMILSSEPSAIRIVDCACAALPDAADQMVWFADDHGLRLKLSQELPGTIAANLPAAIGRLLADNGRKSSDIDHWLVHPGGPQILDAVQECLHLPADALELSRGVLRRYGNMSSPTILFIMKELFETKQDGRCIAMAFGPGLTIETVYLEIERGAV